MGKPLLTDEMIERANRGEAISGPPLFDEEETKKSGQTEEKQSLVPRSLMRKKQKFSRQETEALVMNGQ